MITLEQQEEVVRLYQSHLLTIKQIKENYKRKKDNDNRRKDSQTD